MHINIFMLRRIMYAGLPIPSEYFGKYEDNVNLFVSLFLNLIYNEVKTTKVRILNIFESVRLYTFLRLQGDVVYCIITLFQSILH